MKVGLFLAFLLVGGLVEADRLVWPPPESSAIDQVYRVDLPTPDVWLFVPPLDRPMTLWWDDRPILQSGDPQGRGRFKTMSSQGIALPGPVARPRLELHWFGKEPLPPGFWTGTQEQVSTAVFIRNALGPGLTLVFVGASVFFSIAIALLMSLSQGHLRSVPGGAVLAANGFYILTWLNMLVSLTSVPETPLAVLTHWGLTGWTFTALYLTLVFTETLTPGRARLWLLTALAAVPGVIWITFAPEPAEVVRRYNLAVAPVNIVVDLATVAVGLTAALRRPQFRNRVYAMVLVPSMFASFHDIGWFVIVGQRPYFAFLPLVGMVLNLFFITAFFYELTKVYGRIQQEVAARTQDLDRFVGLLGHDLKNVVQGLHRGFEILTDPGLRPRGAGAQDHLLGTLRDTTAEAHRLLGTLLSLSQSRMGILVPAFAPVRVDELWTEACRPLMADALRRGIRLVFSPSSEVSILADPEMCHAILRNLVDNALRHGVGTVACGDLRGADGGLDLVVDSEGPPLSCEALEELFELAGRRFRDDASGGFGLPLCRDLAIRQGFRLGAVPLASGNRFVLAVPPGNVLPSGEGNPSFFVAGVPAKVNP